VAFVITGGLVERSAKQLVTIAIAGGLSKGQRNNSWRSLSRMGWRGGPATKSKILHLLRNHSTAYSTLILEKRFEKRKWTL